MPAAGDVAVAQRGATISLARRARSTAAPAERPERHDGHARERRRLGEPLEQLGRLERLDHHGEPEPWRTNQRAAHSQPPRWGRARMAPVPAASASWTWSRPSMVTPGVDLGRRHGRAGGRTRSSSGRRRRTPRRPPGRAPPVEVLRRARAWCEATTGRGPTWATPARPGPAATRSGPPTGRGRARAARGRGADVMRGAGGPTAPEPRVTARGLRPGAGAPPGGGPRLRRPPRAASCRVTALAGEPASPAAPKPDRGPAGRPPGRQALAATGRPGTWRWPGATP